jgi:hypothetical protein
MQDNPGKHPAFAGNQTKSPEKPGSRVRTQQLQAQSRAIAAVAANAVRLPWSWGPAFSSWEPFSSGARCRQQ